MCLISASVIVFVRECVCVFVRVCACLCVFVYLGFWQYCCLFLPSVLLIVCLACSSSVSFLLRVSLTQPSRQVVVGIFSVV